MFLGVNYCSVRCFLQIIITVGTINWGSYNLLQSLRIVLVKKFILSGSRIETTSVSPDVLYLFRYGNPMACLAKSSPGAEINFTTWKKKKIDVSTIYMHVTNAVTRTKFHGKRIYFAAKPTVHMFSGNKRKKINK